MAVRKQTHMASDNALADSSEDAVVLESRYTSGFSKLAIAAHLNTRIDALWQGATLTIARRVLVSYWRTGWLAGECLLALALAAVMFWNPGSAPSVFTSASTGYGALALFGGALLATSAGERRVAGPLIHAHSRQMYARGVMLAAAAMRLLTVGAVLVLVCAFHRIVGASAGAVLAGALGLLVTCVVLAALAMALSLSRVAQTACAVALALFVLALWSYASPPPLGGVLVIFRLPLLPIVACYNFGVTGVIGWVGILALLVASGYVAALTRVVAWRLPGDDAVGEAGEAGEAAVKGVAAEK